MKKAQNMPYQSRTLGAEAWYRFKKNKLALGALAIFILLALMAITTIIIDLVTHNSLRQVRHFSGFAAAPAAALKGTHPRYG